MFQKQSRPAAPMPSDLSAEERHAFEQLKFFFAKGVAYGLEMGNRPQTLYGIADSPVGLAAWILDHDARSLELISRVFDGHPEGLTRDNVLDNITLYWLTNTAISSARLYWENKLPFFDVKNVSIPVAVSAFPDEIYHCSTKLGRAGISQTHPLQQARQRRAFCCLGTATTLFRRRSRRLQTTAQIMEQRNVLMSEVVI